MSLFFKYNPLWCFKGGGGGGGTGAVSHSAYMETFHGQMLDHAGVDTVTSSIVDIINASLGNSPYVGEIAYDPDIPLAAMQSELVDFGVLVDLLSDSTGLDDLIDNILSDARIDDSVTEFSTDLGNRLTAEVLPRFQAGMRDINAVVSSAFAIGRAVIEDGQTRQVARYSADLHMKAFGDDALRLIALKLEGQKNLTHYSGEINRMSIVAKKEETETQLEIDESDAIWDLELFAYGGNLLAGIGGGVFRPDTKKRNKAASAIGGAMTGAAAGFMVAGPWGAAAGAVMGAAAGYMSEQ